MNINAKEKIMNAINNKLSEYELITKKEVNNLNEIMDVMDAVSKYELIKKKINNLNELMDIMDTVEETYAWQGYCQSFDPNRKDFLRISNKNEIHNATTYEYCYENNLKYFITQYSFLSNEDNRLCTYEQHLLLKDNKKIVNILFRSYKISTTQVDIMLITKGARDQYRFYSFTNLDIDALFQEKVYLCDMREDNDLFKTMTWPYPKNLSIFYDEETPVYAQFDNNDLAIQVEDAGFNSFSSVDIQKIIKIINDDAIDSIINNINDTLEKQKVIKKI